MEMRGFSARIAAFLGVLVLLTVTSMASASNVSIHSGHAGHWYSPERDGEGWVLELRTAGDAWLYWFTYDEAGGQRWLTATGQIVTAGDGERIEFEQLVVTRGARFGSAFDPDDVEREAVGSASLEFTGCDEGSFRYTAFGQSQEIPVQRLARVMGTRCESRHGVTGREVADHAGQSGSWFDPSHNGEGFALHWAAPGQAIVTWYSYDGEGNQYWMLGVGQLDAEGRIHFPDVHATRGARFGAAFDPDDVERFEWGSLTFDLACGGGTAEYASVLPSFGDGQFELSRLTSLEALACPWQRPALADLYEIELIELPVAIDGSDDEIYRQIGDLNVKDDGDVWAIVTLGSSDQRRVAHLPAGAGAWSIVGDITPARLYSGGLFVRGDQVFANAVDDEGDTSIVVWNGEQWRPAIPAVDRSIALTGVSSDGQRFVGHDTEGSLGVGQPWTWTHEDGFIELSTDIVGGGPTRPVPLFTSNDGTRMFGQSASPRPDPLNFRLGVLTWLEENELQFLPSIGTWRPAQPRACSVDCQLLFGGASQLVIPGAAITPPRPRYEPWYRHSDGRSGFLGVLPSRPGARYIVHGAAGDGNTVVGVGGSFITFSAGPDADVQPADDNDDPRVDGFIWMPDVGMTSVAELLMSAGYDMPALEYLSAPAISPNGRTVVIYGEPPSDQASNGRERYLGRLVFSARD
jgi:hypothetical protein